MIARRRHLSSGIWSELKALRIVSTDVHGEYHRTSFTKNSRSVDMRKELRAARAVVEEHMMQKALSRSVATGLPEP
jgi:hypothetical protein